MVIEEPPLVVFDTNVLLDAFLEQQTQAAPIIGLAEKDEIELVVPTFVAQEFRGTAIRTLKANRHGVQEVRDRLNSIDYHAQERGLLEVKSTLDDLENRIESQKSKVDEFLETTLEVAREVETDLGGWRAGYLRWLGGHPPDKEREGFKDCMIFEAVLEIAREDEPNDRPLKVFSTADDDFDDEGLQEELQELGFEMSSNVGELYGRLSRFV